MGPFLATLNICCRDTVNALQGLCGCLFDFVGASLAECGGRTSLLYLVDFSVTYDELPIWQQPVAKLRWALSRLDPVSVAERPRPQGKRFALHPSNFRWLAGIRVVRFQRLTRATGNVLWSVPHGRTGIVRPRGCILLSEAEASRPNFRCSNSKQRIAWIEPQRFHRRRSRALRQNQQSPSLQGGQRESPTLLSQRARRKRRP